MAFNYVSGTYGTIDADLRSKFGISAATSGAAVYANAVNNATNAPSGGMIPDDLRRCGTCLCLQRQRQREYRVDQPAYWPYRQHGCHGHQQWRGSGGQRLYQWDYHRPPARLSLDSQRPPTV